jgi:hypothetical protein
MISLVYRLRAGLLAASLLCLCPAVSTASQATAGPPAPHPLSVRSYLGRCLDFGAPPLKAGSPVFISDCNATAAQQVVLEEFTPPQTLPVAHVGGGGLTIPQDHQVRLHAGNLCIAAASGHPADNTPLKLEQCSFFPSQIFVLDGDSIILDSDRDLVVQLQNGVTKNTTPLVLGHRSLSDTEFWDFVDASGLVVLQPTSAFVVVSTSADLQAALSRAGINTVIQIPASAPSIVFTSLTTSLPVKGGVTLRGDRRRMALGPELVLSVDSGTVPQSSLIFTGFLEVLGSNARITGLRIRGPSRDNDCAHNPDASCNQHGVAGIITEVASETVKITIDHNDMSDWTRAAIDLYSFHGEDPRICQELGDRPHNVVIARNFVHDNRQAQNNLKDSDGYGIAAGWGSNPLVLGNTFSWNVHSVTSDGAPFSGYAVWDNLFLSSQISANVDMHGSGPSHDGGIGGAGAEVLRNTFLDTTHANFSIRGFPCSGAIDLFRDNVALLSLENSVQWSDLGQTAPPYLRIDSKFTVLQSFEDPYKYSLSNPTRLLGVGNFDGDDRTDLFLATGAAWYYAPSANAEWRLLSEKTDRINSLLFGDFDGDGVTDVFTQVGEDWLVSWGGRSPWQVLSNRHSDWSAPGTGNGSHSIADYFIGDFVGDKRSDVFYADGVNWYVSDGGVGPFQLWATSSFLVPDLAFGHFDQNHREDPKTDILGVVGNQWMGVFAREEHTWRLVRSEQSNTMNGFIVADFDNDGIDDLLRINGSVLQTSRDAVGDWKQINDGASLPVAFGNFDDFPGADVLIWNGNSLDAFSSGTGSAQRRSRQDMR